MKACTHSLYFSDIVHQGGRSAAECGSVANEMGGVDGESVYITQNSGRSACFPGDRDFLVFGNVFERCYYSSGCGVCEIVVPYVRVSSYFL